MQIQFVYPEAFLLLPLLVLLLRRRLWPRPLVGSLRVLVLLLLAVVLAQPIGGTAQDGRDVVLVVDRSRSMPADHLQKVRELAQAIAQDLPAGDRIGVVAFARNAAVVANLASELQWSDDVRALDPDGSSLGDALATAVAMIEPGRNATLLVCSDGEVDAAKAMSVVRLAQRRGIRIDVLPIARDLGVDAAVHELRVPAEIPLEAPFAVNATVISTVAGSAQWRLLVAGELVRSGQVALQAGRNTLQLQHRVMTPGEQTMALEVVLAGDVRPQNNRGMAVMRGAAKARVLCVTPAGRDDRLTRSLLAVGIEVVVRSAEQAPLTLAELDGFRAVILEDVPASALPNHAMRALKTWVKELGGGLLMTGGANSFGVGGYHLSALEDVLPVTMEIREEQRKLGLAMVMALDRSGSMGASAGGTTKMQLANRGAATAIELMSAMDAVAVLAVDTGAHVIQELATVDETEEILQRVRSIESTGGGIYLGAALHAAYEQLADAEQDNRHVVLFADADDAERPDDYLQFVPELVAAGITVSVIGLGKETDSDAQLLQEIATLGLGRCQFVKDATDLPRVFAQETIQVARSSLIEETTEVRVQPTLQLLGTMPDELPALEGYAVAWSRPRAELDLAAVRKGASSGAMSEQPEPLLAHWQIGLGRSAAFLGEADGALSGAWAEWPGYADFFGTLVRWLAGGTPAGLFVDARRDGEVAVYQLEVDAKNASVLDAVRGVVTEPDGATCELSFTSIANGRVEVRVPLVAEGVHRAAVQIGGDTVRLPPMCLPYSAEWQLQLDPQAGERILRDLARPTAGNVAPTVAVVLSGPRRSLLPRDLAPWFAIVALLVLLVEIAVRRLQVQWQGSARRSKVARTAAAANDGAPTQVGGAPRPAAKQPKDGQQPADGDSLLSALERAHKRGSRRV